MQRRELSEDEMRAVTKVYDFASKIKKGEINLKAGRLTLHVAKAMNTSSRTVSRIIHAHRRGEPLPTGFQHLRGRRAKVTINAVELLRQFILPRSENGIRTSVPAMQHMLQSHGFQLSEETIRKTVTNMGFMWAPGHRRRVAAERPENILFRTHYLRMKRNNRDENNLPILPEVFIDESYVH